MDIHINFLINEGDSSPIITVFLPFHPSFSEGQIIFLTEMYHINTTNKKEIPDLPFKIVKIHNKIKKFHIYDGIQTNFLMNIYVEPVDVELLKN